ncbi:hypothetical protein DENSPDRAFT_699375 [Dentipellis sp. KUC8613]|nr:hypothetical protein DENSPDRAFT_699375 [Dentipellis sp. KUC8613]
MERLTCGTYGDVIHNNDRGDAQSHEVRPKPPTTMPMPPYPYLVHAPAASLPNGARAAPTARSPCTNSDPALHQRLRAPRCERAIVIGIALRGPGEDACCGAGSKPGQRTCSRASKQACSGASRLEAPPRMILTRARCWIKRCGCLILSHRGIGRYGAAVLAGSDSRLLGYWDLRIVAGELLMWCSSAVAALSLFAACVVIATVFLRVIVIV